MRRDHFRFAGGVAVLSILLSGITLSQTEVKLPQDLLSKIDLAAQDVLGQTGVPSASVAVVKDGAIVYLRAYGDARLEPKTPAKSEMRYSIGSISKQFTATSVLLRYGWKVHSQSHPSE
jgi:CubicO group peptidase (beta-lactamase class C family)